MNLKTLFAVAATTLSISQSVQAAITIDFNEVGGDVVMNLSGTFNLNAINPYLATSNSALDWITPFSGFVFIPGIVDRYSSIFSPNAFGTGGSINWTSTSGDPFWLSNNQLAFPGGFVSGDPLSSSGTIENTTFALVGLTPGTHVNEYMKNSTKDTITINIGVVPDIPLPASLPLLLGAIGGFAALRRRI